MTTRSPVVAATAEPFDTAGLDAFVRRLRGDFDEIYPGSWQIDWQHIPSPFRWYEKPDRIDLPVAPPAFVHGGREEAETVAAHGQLSWLGALLQASYGVTGVRWYPEGTAKSSPEQPAPVHREAHYQLRRPVPSGGVTYPAECYVCATGDATLPGGIYHYDAVRHALVPLAEGRPPEPLAPRDAEARIVLTVPLWKNYFKYSDFSYRLAAIDTGTVAGQVALTGRRCGWTVRVLLGGDEPAVLRGLGLDPEEEAAPVLLDVATGCDPTGGGRTGGTGTATVPPLRWRGGVQPPDPRAGARRMHASCLRAAQGGVPVPLPPIAAHDRAGRTVLPEVPDEPPAVADAWSRTALGEQYRGSPIPIETMARWLAETSAPLAGDVASAAAGAGPAQPRCVLLVRSVPGLAPGAYLAGPDGRDLGPLADGDLGPVVQRSLFGSYMNFAQAPLIAVLVGDAAAHRGPAGALAYRAQHLLAGVLAQRLAVAAARDGYSAHPVLGFVTAPLATAAGLEPLGLTPLLLVAVGRYRRALYLESSLHPCSVEPGGPA